MVNFLSRLFGRSAPPAPEPTPEPVAETPVISIDALAASGFIHANYDGDKFLGGFGDTTIPVVDYWTLRARSAQLFQENLYARGMIRRLVTNEINTGLTPEAAPDEEALGLAPDSLVAWSETVEKRYSLWAQSPQTCDFKGVSTFGAIQRIARMEALVGGDVLVVLRQSAVTAMPQVQLIAGEKINTPIRENTTRGPQPRIEHGVEFDADGRQAAFHILQEDGTYKRLPAYGPKSGRRMAWLVYGTDKRLDDVRGQPILAIVLQSLKEIDRYRDSAQRKAVINSVLAMFIEKGENKPGTLPMTGAAVRRDSVTTAGSATEAPRKFDIASQIPGVVLQELQHGEKPVGFHSQGTDVNFGQFEEAIIQAVAWANEIPPEIMRLAFSNNYSASQAAINEFKIYLNRIWSEWGESFCQPIYTDWLISETLRRKLTAPGLLEAWRNPAAYDVFAAYTATDWYGSIKPSTDMLKQVRGSDLLVAGGYSTRAREARVTTGTKFSKNIKRLKSENVQLADAMRPLLELQAQYPAQAAAVIESAQAYLAAVDTQESA